MSTETIAAIGRELKDNPPSIVASTRRKFGPARANKQRVAILLSKARKAGASISKSKGMKHG